MADVLLYTGSKSSLEEMTGKTYVALKNDDESLVELVAKSENYELRSPQSLYPSSIKGAQKSLRSQAKALGADALVEVRYVFVGASPEHSRMLTGVYAAGYAVKENKL